MSLEKPPPCIHDRAECHRDSLPEGPQTTRAAGLDAAALEEPPPMVVADRQETRVEVGRTDRDRGRISSLHSEMAARRYLELKRSIRA